MFSFLITLAVGWLFVKALALSFKIAWGAAKAAAVLLSVLAIPVLIIGLVCVGGVFLLIPLALVGSAFGLLKLCT